MSSRFFAAGSDSDSESSSSSDEELSYSEQEDQGLSDNDSGFDDNDDDEEGSDSNDDQEKAGLTGRDAFLRDRVASDDSDDDGTKRVVQSARDKRWQEIEATANLIENKGKINDWVVISNGTPSLSLRSILTCV
jgi:translation initiation factor 3 subunit C